MISSGKINNKFIKMEEIINGLKQIKTRVDSGTITTVNGTETLLSKQLEKMIEEAINYTRCCKSDSEQLICERCKEIVDTLEDDVRCEYCSYYVSN
jgi:hypothetical protein